VPYFPDSTDNFIVPTSFSTCIRLEAILGSMFITVSTVYAKGASDNLIRALLSPTHSGSCEVHNRTGAGVEFHTKDFPPVISADQGT
jgi:hypothetical protein